MFSASHKAMPGVAAGQQRVPQGPIDLPNTPLGKQGSHVKSCSSFTSEAPFSQAAPITATVAGEPKGVAHIIPPAGGTWQPAPPRVTNPPTSRAPKDVGGHLPDSSY